MLTTDERKAIAADEKASRKTRWERIGIAAMDTACLMITDPCYVRHYDESNQEPVEISSSKQAYDAMKTPGTDKENEHGQINFRMGHAGAGVIMHSPHGDGSVAIWAKLDARNRVRSVFFSFDGEAPSHGRKK